MKMKSRFIGKIKNKMGYTCQYFITQSFIIPLTVSSVVSHMYVRIF